MNHLVLTNIMTINNQTKITKEMLLNYLKIYTPLTILKYFILTDCLERWKTKSKFEEIKAIT